MNNIYYHAGMKFDLDKCNLIADDEYQDNPSNRDNLGKNQYLYQTPRSKKFFFYCTSFTSYPKIVVASHAEAMEFYDSASNQYGDYEDIFGEAEEY